MLNKDRHPWLWIPIFELFWFDLKREWTQTYQLPGGRSYHYTTTLNQALQNLQATMHKLR